jgi:hypothetical protein
MVKNLTVTIIWAAKWKVMGPFSTLSPCVALGISHHWSFSQWRKWFMIIQWMYQKQSKTSVQKVLKSHFMKVTYTTEVSKSNIPCCARFTPDARVTSANPTQMMRTTRDVTFGSLYGSNRLIYHWRLHAKSFFQTHFPRSKRRVWEIDQNSRHSLTNRSYFVT